VSAPRRIVVGVDGSQDAQLALRWAIDMAGATGGEVVAVHALGLLAHVAGSDLESSQGHLDQIRALFEGDWCAALGASSVTQRCLLVDGNPVTALLGAAAELGADLIVVGSRGTGGFAGLQLGSTSHQLVQHSDRPVVVVPPTGRGPSPGA